MPKSDHVYASFLSFSAMRSKTKREKTARALNLPEDADWQVIMQALQTEEASPTEKPPE